MYTPIVHSHILIRVMKGAPPMRASKNHYGTYVPHGSEPSRNEECISKPHIVRLKASLHLRGAHE